MKGYVEVKLQIDDEIVAPLLGTLAFLENECFVKGLQNDGTICKRNWETTHYGMALNYISYISSEIGAAALEAAAIDPPAGDPALPDQL